MIRAFDLIFSIILIMILIPIIFPLCIILKHTGEGEVFYSQERIGQNGKAINLQDVQERMISKMSNTTRLIEKLRIKDLVSRIQCESNRRKIEISITDKGLELLSVIDKSLGTHEKDTTKNLTEKESILLNKLLNKLRTNNK